MSSRLKREECKRTKHDSVFSKWQILIGPRDWEDHALGKDGVERYRIHNLPPCSSCPGLYELGISEIPREGHKSRGHPSDGIVVVYLGQADNVRARLQQYGRAGSHLERGNSIVCANNNKDLCLVKGPGLFKEVFSKGYSVLFRWAPMIDKKEAEKIESKLLSTFDYAWNTRANGTSRREDVLNKISSTMTGQPIPKVLKNLQEWKQLTFNKKSGNKDQWKCSTDKLGSSNFLKHYLIPLIRKVSKILPQPNEGDEVLSSEHDICGAANGDGSICRRKPVLRNKRCMQHKGKRIILYGHIKSKEVLPSTYNSSLVGLLIEDNSLCMELPCNETQQCEKLREISPIENLKTEDESLDVEYDHSKEYQICRVLLRDGNICRSKPFPGRKRCEDHKGMRVTGIISMTTKECLAKEISSDTELDPCEEYQICGVFLGDGDVCQSKPFPGRKRCEYHKGMKVTGIISMTTRECLAKGISSDTELDPCEDYQICGVLFGDGNVCQSMRLPGRKRCEYHKGMRINGIISRTPREFSIAKITPSDGELDPCEGNQICGVLLGDGNVCRSKPFRGRKRCEDHRGIRVDGITSRTTRECSITKKVSSGAEIFHCQEYQTCGVFLADGNVCQRIPIRGRKRCEHHKGRRISRITCQ
ncbi:LOW QUALITY PROTEIN: protein EFFECTOR OF TRANSCRIPTION 2-like [Dioscorea cayenensis subsp. rotundata]|uniref:LOW QUALITY PROTEIN: protein EFFECTOR OF TRANSCRIPTION 2-like n=1 Tax=Dioscorea cayennensis subsp. rotundata TaxID=55577 RepID=A0AB40BMV4_DIOCR|nr:LOW QUALITY PROTEIN: protein EFFECTOR OF TRANSCRIPTION 2-like [Dioscorea cayenensis subsp. rotundata]